MAEFAILKTALTALALNYGVHFGSTFAYGKLCVPQSVWEIAQSLAATSSPICSTLLSTMQLTQNNFAVVMTTTVASVLTGLIKP